MMFESCVYAVLLHNISKQLIYFVMSWRWHQSKLSRVDLVFHMLRKFINSMSKVKKLLYFRDNPLQFGHILDNILDVQFQFFLVVSSVILIIVLNIL